jgi:hypothetical protein
MRYRPKSIGALQIVLGGLPDKMRVEADPDTGVSAKSVGDSEAGSVARKFGGDNPARSRSQKCCKGQQSQRGDSHLAETVDHSPADSPAPTR